MTDQADMEARYADDLADADDDSWIGLDADQREKLMCILIGVQLSGDVNDLPDAMYQIATMFENPPPPTRVHGATGAINAQMVARARELGILDRVLTDAENAIYDAGMAAAYARAAEVMTGARDDIAFAINGAWNEQGGVPFPLDQREAEALADAAIKAAILALGEAKG